jgi:hypothetical protein
MPNIELACEVEIQPGQKLTLPSTFIAGIGPGRWIVSVRPAPAASTRRHDAFLSSYAAADEGLYDDLAR